MLFVLFFFFFLKCNMQGPGGNESDLKMDMVFEMSKITYSKLSPSDIRMGL